MYGIPHDFLEDGMNRPRGMTEDGNVDGMPFWYRNLPELSVSRECGCWFAGKEQECIVPCHFAVWRLSSNNGRRHACSQEGDIDDMTGNGYSG